MSLCVGLPTRGVVFTDTLRRVLEVAPDQIITTTVAPVSEARNSIVRQFLKTSSTWLLMLDDDEVPPPAFVGTLLLTLQENGITGVAVMDCPSKKTGKSNVFINPDGTIAASGFGCALFPRCVFETITDPWFDLAPRRRLEKSNGVWQFPVIDDAPPNPWGGEDINFSIKLHEAGIAIYQAPGLCTHLEIETLNRENRATELVTIKSYATLTGSPL